MRYVIYDTETTGTDTTFDQILQFAAVQTDDELNVVEELDIRCRLLPHVVPSPEAMLVTGVPAGRLTDPMLPSHHEMVVTIHKTLLAWSPATFLGWNSLSFDELLLREAFYQNLFPPFLTNVNGNRRSDLLRMARAAAIVAPGTLAPATSADGNPSFKLDRLAPANGFTHDQAHDALADVRATLHLARLIKPKAPAVWSAFMRFGHKANVLEYLHAHRLFGFLPCRSTDTAALIGTTIGALPRNPAALLFQDLTVSAAWLCELSDDRLAKRLQQFPRPIHQLKTNESPFLLTPDEAAPFHRMPGINLEELKRRAQFLKANPAVRERLTDAVATLYPAYDPSPHVEQQIYDGFFSREDQIQLNRFHDAAWQERPALVQQFEDPRLRRLGQRLLFLERPDVLPRETRQAFAKTMHERLKTGGETVPWRTLNEALAQAESILATTKGTQHALVQEHRAFLAGLAALPETQTR